MEPIRANSSLKIQPVWLIHLSRSILQEQICSEFANFPCGQPCPESSSKNWAHLFADVSVLDLSRYNVGAASVQRHNTTSNSSSSELQQRQPQHACMKQYGAASISIFLLVESIFLASELHHEDFVNHNVCTGSLVVTTRQTACQSGPPP